MTTLITALLTSIVSSVVFAGVPEADPQNCPATQQKVLVIDLKSGWWRGDGGTFGDELMTSLQKACSTLTFEYRHSTYGYGYGGYGGFQFPVFFPSDAQDITNDDMAQLTTTEKTQMDEMDPTASGPNKFPKEPFENYSQIWLLSGGEADSVDLRTNSAEFQRYLKGMVESGANLFVGASFGNIYHANALSEGLGLGEIFKTDREATVYPNAMGVIEKQSELQVDQIGHPIFSGVTTLPDVVKVSGHAMSSDHILAHADVRPILKNGEIVIAEIQQANRNILLEGGLHRFYNIRSDDSSTLSYMQNILVYLSR